LRQFYLPTGKTGGDRAARIGIGDSVEPVSGGAEGGEPLREDARYAVGVGRGSHGRLPQRWCYL
jgi:hypothetical protein